MKKSLSLFLCALMLLPVFGMLFGASALQSAPDAEDPFILGSLSARYESNGDPGSIANSGDVGGTSYGAYMFASAAGVPLDFANWCVSSGQGVSAGNRLKSAYAADKNSYGAKFNAEWKKLAAEDSYGFLLLQHNYTKARFYDVMVSRVESRFPGFKASSYSYALQNVIWSRAVQHGVYSDVIISAFEAIGGYNGKSEEQLIRAIHTEAARVTATAPRSNSIALTSSTVARYGLDPSLVGKYMVYFSTNPSDIQGAVYVRLMVNELNDALAMLRKYGGTTGGDVTTQAPQPTTTQPATTQPAGITDVFANPANLSQALVNFLNVLVQMFIRATQLLAQFIANISAGSAA